MKVAIIGGGISGLSSAYYLAQQAEEKGQDIEIILLESEDYWGGKIKTSVEGGFVVEGGPDAYLVTKPWMRTLAKELGLGEDLQGTNPKYSKTYILHQGKLNSIPTGLTMTIPTEFGPMLKTNLMTWSEKIRMGLDFIIPAKKEIGDESLAGFISRRLGRAAYDRLVGPLLSGIYAGDGDQLSLQSTFPMLREMEIEHGGLIKGALALKLKRAKMAIQRSKSPKETKKATSRSIFESPKSGLNTIVDAMVSKLEDADVELRLNTIVNDISEINSGYQLTLNNNESIEIDGIILATPAFVSGKLIEKIIPELMGELESIQYATTATVSIAYYKKDLPTKLEGYGYIIPQEEDSKALACTWTSSKWDHRAPDDYALIRVFIGRIQDEEPLPTDENKLIEMALKELQKTMGIETEPIHCWVFRWENAMPQYNLGHPARLERIEATLQAIPSIALAGNGYRGIGMPDCIRSGIEASKKIFEYSIHMDSENEQSKVN